MNVMRCLGRCLGLLLAMCLADASQADTQIRTSGFDYDARGLLIREVMEPDRPNDCLQIRYLHDAWGNKVGVVTEACPGASGHTVDSAAAARAAITSWGSDGRFPVRTTNALGHSEAQTFDPRFGVPTRLVGPNGLATTWAYDGLGRRTREQRADGTAATWRYLLCTEPGADCPAPIGGAASAWVVVEQSLGADGRPNAPEKRQVHDKLGRVSSGPARPRRAGTRCCPNSGRWARCRRCAPAGGCAGARGRRRSSRCGRHWPAGCCPGRSRCS